MQVSRFSRLPLELQREVEERLVRNGFSDYRAIVEELTARGHTISLSSLHRTGTDLKRRFEKRRDDHMANIAGLKHAPSRDPHD